MKNFIRSFYTSIVALALSPVLSQAAPPQCVDFSGTWEGSCTAVNADGREATVPSGKRIYTQSGCEEFSEDGLSYTIGKIKTKEMLAASEVTAAFWNKDRTELKVSTTGLWEHLKVSDDSVRYSEYDMFYTTTKYSFQDGKLVTDATGFPSSEIIAKMRCVLEKH